MPCRKSCCPRIIVIDTNVPIPLVANAYATTALRNLIRFNTSFPHIILSAVPITGLGLGESILGLDIRPSTGVLYALGSSSQLYTINPITGVATAVGVQLFPLLSGSEFGFDFNPTVDLIRIVSNLGQNLRVNPTTGVVIVDTPIAAPNSIFAVAYTNSVPGALTTTLYDIDAFNNTLAIQNPPAAGTIVPVGSLGVLVSAPTAFDIRPFTDEPILAVRNGTVSTLYRVNLITGSATLLGNVNALITGLALL